MSTWLLHSLALPSVENSGLVKMEALKTPKDLEGRLNDMKTSIFDIPAEDLWTILDDTEILKTKIGELKQYEASLIKEEKQ